MLSNQQGARRKAEPDWAYVHHELRRPGVTLMLLWEEYRQCEPDGYAYSRWCELYRAWEGRLSPTMRQAHPAGERMFVDYAGQTVDLINPGTGEVRPAQIFVAVMGASIYTYAEATLTQSLPDGRRPAAISPSRLPSLRTEIRPSSSTGVMKTFGLLPGAGRGSDLHGPCRHICRASGSSSLRPSSL